MATSPKIDDTLKGGGTATQEALASWAAFRKTGLHLTGREVRDWLGTWGSDDEAPMPACHT